MRIRTRLLPLLFLVFVLPTIGRAQTCHTGGGGGCAGDCPRERPICAKVGGNCTCTGSIILEPFTQPWPEKEISALELVATFSSQLLNPDGGDWLAPGKSISFTQASEVTVLIRHSKTWGGGKEYVTVPAGILHFVAHLDGYDLANPQKIRISFTSLSAVLPSFPSIALKGDVTGDNVFSEIEKATEGWIDPSTGAFAVNVYAQFFNNIFCKAPAIVQGHFEGTFNIATKEATITYSPASVNLISDSPSSNPAF